METLKRIDFDDLETLKVFASKEVLMKGQEVLGEFAKESKIQYQDVLIALGLANGKYSRNVEEKCFEYLILDNPTDKNAFLAMNPTLNELFIKEVIEYKENLAKELNDIPSKLVKFIVESTNKESLFNQILELLDLATEDHINIKTLEKTDIYVIAELIIRIIKKPKASLEKALFLNSFIVQAKKMFQSLSITTTGKKAI